MKKMMTVLAVVFLVGMIVTSAFGQIYDQDPTRKVFTDAGEFQRYVNFSFEVPSGNCGQFEVYEYLPAYPFFSIHGEWEKKNPGEKTGKGWYRFINNNAGACSQKVGIYGYLDFVEQSDSGWMRELEPEEIGLFVKDQWSENNFFGLSADDRKFSYFLLAPGEGVNYSLADLLSLKDNLRECIGVIVSDSRGFLKEVIWKKVNRKGKNIVRRDIVFHADDVVVMIYKETAY